MIVQVDVEEIDVKNVVRDVIRRFVRNAAYEQLGRRKHELNQAMQKRSDTFFDAAIAEIEALSDEDLMVRIGVE